MAHPTAAWGIEIGQYAIKAIRLERDGDSVRVTDYEVVQHQRVLSSPDIDTTEVTRLSLGQLISQKNLEGEHLVISVPGHSSFARFAKLPPVEPKAIPDIDSFKFIKPYNIHLQLLSNKLTETRYSERRTDANNFCQINTTRSITQ